MDELRPIFLNEQRDVDHSICENPGTVARGEFLTFTRVVTELFGPEQAKQSAEDWLNELTKRDCMPGANTCEWRLVTVAAMARLTIRMTVELQKAGTARPVD